jgi:hypothetical protein
MLIVRNCFTRKTANLNDWRETSSTRSYISLAIQKERCNPAVTDMLAAMMLKTRMDG